MQYCRVVSHGGHHVQTTSLLDQLDPGFAFGKTTTHNLTLVNRLEAFCSFGVPVLLGVSRKSTIGNVLDKDVDDRLFGSLALTVMGLERGVKVIRAHDVGATMDVIKMCEAVRSA